MIKKSVYRIKAGVHIGCATLVYQVACCSGLVPCTLTGPLGCVSCEPQAAWGVCMSHWLAFAASFRCPFIQSFVTTAPWHESRPAVPAPSCRLACRLKRANGYKTLGINGAGTLAQLHPACAELPCDDDGLPPPWLVYHELVATSRTFLRQVGWGGGRGGAVAS